MNNDVSLIFPSCYYHKDNKKWVGLWMKGGLPYYREFDTQEEAIKYAVIQNEGFENRDIYPGKFTLEEYDLIIREMQDRGFIFLGGSCRTIPALRESLARTILSFEYKPGVGDIHKMTKSLTHIKHMFKCVICYTGMSHVAIYPRDTQVIWNTQGDRVQFAIHGDDKIGTAEEYEKLFPKRCIMED